MSEVSYLPLIEDMTWSYSRIETFSDCPYRFFLKYISNISESDRFYASYGSFIHSLIERYYKKELSKEELETEFLLGFSNNVKGVRPPQSTVDKYIKCGSEYFRNFKPFDFNMVGVEKKVSFEIDGLPFIGYIDYLGEKDGEYFVIDNKSRDLKPRSKRKKPTQKDQELDKMLRQMYIYSTAVKQEFGKFPKALCFNCFKSGIFIEEPFNIDAYNETIEWVKKNINDIKTADDFYPYLDYFACNNICGVSEECIYHQTEIEERRRGV